MNDDTINEANKIDNPLSLLPEFSNYKANIIDFKIETKRATKLTKQEREWIFSLLERNMKELYKKSHSGWNPKSKKLELFEKAAYYLLVSGEDDKLAGYSHFRFDWDFDDKVVYCYELQVESEYRKMGLGKQMMYILELLASKTKMEKVMLTTFKHNPHGQRFFKQTIGYEIDETDMNDDPDQDLDYEILSKKII